MGFGGGLRDLGFRIYDFSPLVALGFKGFMLTVYVCFTGL